MTKKIFTIIGVTILILASGLWVYLLFFGAPTAVKDTFSNLTNIGVNEPTPITTPPEETLIEISSSPLEQLTERPIAGYAFIESLEEKNILYAERGTGYVFKMDLNAKSENRLLNNTIGKVTDAVFDPEGGSVVLVREEDDNTTSTAWYQISDTAQDTLIIPTDSRDFYLVSSTTLYYTKVLNNQTFAYSFDRKTMETNVLWQIPFVDARVSWNDDGSATISNKVSSVLSGGVYTVSGNNIQKLTETKTSLTSINSQEAGTLVYSYYDKTLGFMVSEKLDTTTNEKTEVPIIVLPEKCAFSKTATRTMWCAGDNNANQNYAVSWYKGILNSQDNIWKVDLESGIAELSINLTDQAGFDIDVTDFTLSNGNIFFINKMNGTLWWYRVGE